MEPSEQLEDKPSDFNFDLKLVELESNYYSFGPMFGLASTMAATFEFVAEEACKFVEVASSNAMAAFEFIVVTMEFLKEQDSFVVVIVAY